MQLRIKRTVWRTSRIKRPAQGRAFLISFAQCRCELIFSSLNASAAVSLVACDAHGDTHAAADAQRGEALLGIALLHFMQQRHQHARAGCTDRMADRDRAAVDLRGIPAEVLVDRAGLRREGFIGLDQVEIADLSSRPSSARRARPRSAGCP